MKLIYSPDPWLEKQVQPFDFDALNAEEVEKEMIDIMLKEGGIGLSANQVGLDAQVFVMKPILLTDKTPFALFNPSIEQVTINNADEPEGCLSHPNLFLKVKRPRGVVVNYLDKTGKECKLELYDIDARCFLHEYDHLQGIEFTERVSKLKLDMARKKQKKVNKRNH
jgi:peptide deformylase